MDVRGEFLGPLRDSKMRKDCTQPLRIGNIRALNGCAGRLFGAAKACMQNVRDKYM